MRQYITVSFLKMLIIDEADETLSNAFSMQIDYIITLISNHYQILVFSTLISQSVMQWAKLKMKDPATVILENINNTPKEIK